MTKQLLDLPSEVLLQIISYIPNVRERLRLASVNSVFQNLVELNLQSSYKLVNYEDYLYESEIKRRPEKPVINLNTLLGIAPRLTHFIDKAYHFSYNEPLPLIHIKYLYVDMCTAYFFGRRYEIQMDKKRVTFFTNLSSVVVLDIRIDHEEPIELGHMPNLKVFRLNFFDTSQFPRFLSYPIGLIDQVLSNAPNLEDFCFNSRMVRRTFSLYEALAQIAIKCPKMRSIRFFFQAPTEGWSSGSNKVPLKDVTPFEHLEYLDIRGVLTTIDFWEELLPLAPNLKYLCLDGRCDGDIRRTLVRNCRNVQYDIDRPFEIEEKYRIYRQQTDRWDCNRSI